MDVLFKNCGILAWENGIFRTVKGYLGVKDKVIDYIGEAKPEKEYGYEKDMSGKLLMPGLINTHTHAAMTLLRGLGAGLPLDKWLFECIFPTEDKLTAADIKTGTYLALLEMIAGGTTSFSDMYFECDGTVEAVIESGMKANIGRPVQFGGEGDPAKDRRILEAIELYKNYNGAADGRVLIDFAVHAEYTCSEKIVRYCADVCREYKGNMHLHLSETEKEQRECIERHGVTPAKWFADLGAFDSDAFAAHCVVVTEEDMDILLEKGVKVVHNPTSNMKLGSGFAPVRRMLDKGITVGLGTDGASSNNNLNMFEEMHLASLIHNGLSRNALELHHQNVLKMATVNGAAIQRRADTGALAVGMKADIVAVDLTAPHMIPANEFDQLLVYSAQGSDVCMTMVDGRILYENGEFKTLDKEKILAEAKTVVKRICG